MGKVQYRYSVMPDPWLSVDALIIQELVASDVLYLPGPEAEASLS